MLPDPGDPQKTIIAVDGSQPRYLYCPPESEAVYPGAVVKVASLGDEGVGLYKSKRNGMHFEESEYGKLLRVTIAHELGHFIVGLWHLDDADGPSIMGDHPFVMDNGSVLGLEDVKWRPEEIERINLRNVAPFSAPPSTP